MEFSLEPAAKVAFSSKNLHTAAEAHLGVARSEPPELVVMVSRLCLRKALPVCPRVHRSRTHEDRGEGGRRRFSEWKFINVFLSAALISVAISVSNGGAFTQLLPDAGGGGAGQRYGRGPLCRQKT